MDFHTESQKDDWVDLSDECLVGAEKATNSWLRSLRGDSARLEPLTPNPESNPDGFSLGVMVTKQLATTFWEKLKQLFRPQFGFEVSLFSQDMSNENPWQSETELEAAIKKEEEKRVFDDKGRRIGRLIDIKRFAGLVRRHDIDSWPQVRLLAVMLFAYPLSRDENESRRSPGQEYITPPFKLS